MAVLIGFIALAWFLLAPHIGRYTVHPEYGVTALRRDEHSQQINDRAARNGFVILGIAVAILSIYFGTFLHTDIPVFMLNYALILGVVAYFVTDFRLRRT